MEWSEIIFLVFSGVVTVAIAVVCFMLKAKFGIEIEAKHREALHQALMSGVAFALRQMGLSAAQATQTNSAALKVKALAYDYVHQSVPDALTHFKLEGSTQIDQMIDSKLALLAEAPPVVVTSGVSPNVGR